MDKAAILQHLRNLEAQLDKENVAAMLVYTQLLKRMQVCPPVVYFTTVDFDAY